MKRLGKVFLGMLCIILLFAYSHASDKRTKVEAKNQKVTFKWSRVEKDTNNTDIRKEDGEVKYVVYVYQTNNKDEKPPIQKEKIDKTKLREESPTPIKETSCEIPFYDKDKGHYFFLGVQALLYKKASKDGKPIVESSTISWSCSETCTNNNPQYVYVPK
jgi:hypothetical protein